MSGITPLIDTLLHQVLGKRADIPTPRDLNEPVRQVDPGEGPRALHSDSRLDGRRPAWSPLTGLSPTPQRGEAPGQQTPLADATRPASFQMHFSPSARTIADLLVRFPAPPSVLSTSAPLMGPGEVPSATALADRLQSGVRDSGLFYESHLSRWYRGEMSRQQLDREPQMWRTLRFSPANAAQQASYSPAMPARLAVAQPGQGSAAQAPSVGQPMAPLAPPLPTGSGLPQGGGTLSPSAQAAKSYAATGALLPTASQGATPPAQGQEAAGTGQRAPAAQAPAAGVESAVGRETMDAPSQARLAAGEPVHESLQGLVRHQLEMLVSPVLRWEGDVWSGIFMALMVQIPAAAQRDGDAGQEEGREEASSETWHSELRLDVPNLGEIEVAMWLRQNTVRLELRAADESALATLREGGSRLQKRLEAAGLDDVLIDTRLNGEGRVDGATRT